MLVLVLAYHVDGQGRTRINGAGRGVLALSLDHDREHPKTV